MTIRLLFWIFLFIIIYAYLGYTLILLLLVIFKKLLTGKKPDAAGSYEPEVTLLVAAYNERECIENKISNSFELDYPKDKLKLVWVTDGSDDGTPQILRQYKDITVLHEEVRKGKINAMNRAVRYIKTPIIIFSDANTRLNKNAIREIINIFRDKSVGCVAGEKRINILRKEKAVGAGEGIYWRYESVIKSLESQFSTVMGAAGELFAIRTELYNDVREDTLLDDFTISLEIAKMGYKIKYAPDAYASESGSLTIKEELKRKFRIASGGLQTLFRMGEVLNVFKYGMLSFQYISHKVLRWTLVPLSFILVFILNFIIVFTQSIDTPLYLYFLYVQLLFYFMILLGALLSNMKIRLKIIFIPYYLFIMNYAMINGILRYISGNQSVKWEKSKRR
ncbi:MAG: glycosyltransferase family 2 protein [Bacteroidales bacterium]|nr:MAG: glycosyltransferase family 2 protein [Bacteroidales bacterium]